jgi:hypothetical protein
MVTLGKYFKMMLQETQDRTSLVKSLRATEVDVAWYKEN